MHCPATASANDNTRVKRYIAKYTINPAIANGFRTTWAGVEIGNGPTWCCGGPAFFGVKPSLIMKGGFIAAALMGDANASIPDAAAGALPADVRQLRPRTAGHVADLHQPVSIAW